MEQPLSLVCRAIGRVRRGRVPGAKEDRWEEAVAEVEVDRAWSEALDGIDGFSHIWLLWWLDCAATAGDGLRVRPERRDEMPVVGLFATRSPFRPNPIAMTAVRLLRREGTCLLVKGLDAYEGTAILDIKPYLDRGDRIEGVTVPDWIARLWALHDRQRGKAALAETGALAVNGVSNGQVQDRR